MTEIIKKIEEYEIITLFGHVRPDGDCLGSQFGLKDIIETTYPNKKVYLVGESSDYIDFLGTIDNPSDDIIEKSLAIICDTANQERISSDKWKLSNFSIKIDHHIIVDQYANINFVDESSPATCQLVCELLFNNNLKITTKGAFALYTGLVTDTGGYRYRNTTEKTLLYASKLVGLGVDVSLLSEKLSQDDEYTVRFKGYILNNFKTNKNVAYIAITKKTLEEYNVSFDIAKNMVNLLSSMDKYSMWLIAVEKDDIIKVSIRSRKTNINQVAAKFNGGGHLLASGATIDNFKQLDEVINMCNEVHDEN